MITPYNPLLKIWSTNIKRKYLKVFWIFKFIMKPDPFRSKPDPTFSLYESRSKYIYIYINGSGSAPVHTTAIWKGIFCFNFLRKAVQDDCAPVALIIFLNLWWKELRRVYICRKNYILTIRKIIKKIENCENYYYDVISSRVLKLKSSFSTSNI